MQFLQVQVGTDGKRVCACVSVEEPTIAIENQQPTWTTQPDSKLNSRRNRKTPVVFVVVVVAKVFSVQSLGGLAPLLRH